MHADAAPLNDVAIIICTYSSERYALLKSAIDSVQAQRGPKPELVIVVDGNPELQRDLTVELEELGISATVVANTGPRGLSHARNCGIAATRAGLVAFLDDDAVADARWLETLVAAFTDPRVKAAGGAVLPALAAKRPAWWPVQFDWVVGCSYDGQLPRHTVADSPVPVRNVIGAGMLIHRTAFDAVGPFSTSLGRVGTIPVGGEETELCIRIAQRFGQGSVVLVPGAIVAHHVPADRLSIDYLHRRCYAEGLSKAVLSKMVGPVDSLSSETSFLTGTLPRAIGRELIAAARGDVGGLQRCAIILSATATTGLGWIMGRLTVTRPPRSAPGSY